VGLSGICTIAVVQRAENSPIRDWLVEYNTPVWRHILPAFERDFRIVLFDYIGHGKSDASAFDRARYGTLDGYADDVLAICEALAIRDAVFVGHSLSSMIGILAAQKAPSRLTAGRSFLDSLPADC
jgi:pimeloyl-ACP methyl ester carboxylesterase